MTEEVTKEATEKNEIFEFFDTLYELHSVQAKLLTIMEQHIDLEGNYGELYDVGLDNIITLQETIDELFPDEDEDETEEGVE
jgi:hypothetical protein